MRRRIGLFFASWLVSGAWLGCNVILGNESAVFVPLERGSAADGSTPDVLVATDGSSNDGGAEDAGPCIEVATNPKHCGACFHDCLGGQCVAGMCQPVELASDESGPFAIAVDATHVYWNNRATGDLWRVPIAGGAKERLFDGPNDTHGETSKLTSEQIKDLAEYVLSL